jgi:hypothetical protein
MIAPAPISRAASSSAMARSGLSSGTKATATRRGSAAQNAHWARFSAWAATYMVSSSLALVIAPRPKVGNTSWLPKPSQSRALIRSSVSKAP